MRTATSWLNDLWFDITEAFEDEHDADYDDERG
jgi:hypothetical protein